MPEIRKGFSVVASEIRKLSEDTSANAKSINSSLKLLWKYYTFWINQ